MQISQKEFDPDNVTKFRLKEDWIFDRRVGRMVCRILGVSPYLDKYSDESGVYQGSFPMFWIYYPDIRESHNKYEVYNPENDVFRMTWDDFFEKRMFSSFVVKSTFNNPNQNDIRSYKKGIYRLYESEKIKEQIFNKEHDLWVY
jgi:gliding motility associated protien GldN